LTPETLKTPVEVGNLAAGIERGCRRRRSACQMRFQGARLQGAGDADGGAVNPLGRRPLPASAGTGGRRARIGSETTYGWPTRKAWIATRKRPAALLRRRRSDVFILSGTDTAMTSKRAQAGLHSQSARNGPTLAPAQCVSAGTWNPIRVTSEGIFTLWRGERVSVRRGPQHCRA
jgi:hypothetical protein